MKIKKNLSTTELCDSYVNIVKKLTQKTREKISKNGGAQFELFILKEKIAQFEKLLSRELDARNFVEVNDEVNYKKWCKLDDSRAATRCASIARSIPSLSGGDTATRE